MPTGPFTPCFQHRAHRQVYPPNVFVFVPTVVGWAKLSFFRVHVRPCWLAKDFVRTVVHVTGMISMFYGRRLSRGGAVRPCLSGNPPSIPGRSIKHSQVIIVALPGCVNDLPRLLFFYLLVDPSGGEADRRVIRASSFRVGRTSVQARCFVNPIRRMVVVLSISNETPRLVRSRGRVTLQMTPQFREGDRYQEVAHRCYVDCFFNPKEECFPKGLYYYLCGNGECWGNGWGTFRSYFFWD